MKRRLDALDSRHPGFSTFHQSLSKAELEVPPAPELPTIRPTPVPPPATRTPVSTPASCCRHKSKIRKLETLLTSNKKVINEQRAQTQMSKSVRHVKSLRRELDAARDDAEAKELALKMSMKKLEAEVAVLRRKLVEMDEELKAETQRADRAVALAARHRKERNLIDMERRLLQASTSKLQLQNEKMRKAMEQRKHFRDMSADDQKKLLINLLCTLDAKCISDVACAELAATVPSMPRIGKMKQLRKKMNKRLRSMLGMNHPDLKISRGDEAMVDPGKMIQAVVDHRFPDGPPGDTCRVMLCMDGRAMGKQSQADGILVSVALLDEGDAVSAIEHLHPLAIWRVKEECDLLKPCFLKLRKQLESVELTSGQKIECHLGGDMKMLLCLSGRADARNKGQTCLCCPCDMAGRKDMNKLADWMECVLDSKEEKFSRGEGLRENPLEGFIPRERIVMDPLHCLLRMFDVLFERLRQRLVSHLGLSKAHEAILACTRKLVPNFRFFQNKAGEWCYTSINGNDRLCLLRDTNWKEACKDMPSADFGAHIEATFKGFAELHITVMNSADPPPPSVVKTKLASWVRAAVIDGAGPAGQKKKKRKKGGRRRAGTASDVRGKKGEQTFTSDELMTVHVHHITAHLHELVRLHKSLKPFSMQNLELHNNMDGKAWARKCSRRRESELLETLLRQCRLTFSEATNRKVLCFLCPECGAGFKKRGNMEVHRRDKHGVKLLKEHKCDACGKAHKNRQSLVRHRRSSHVGFC